MLEVRGTPLLRLLQGRDNNEDHYHAKLTHLMHFDVEEDDFDEAISILIDNDGYGNNKD